MPPIDPVRVDRLTKRLCAVISSEFVYLYDWPPDQPGYLQARDVEHERNRLVLLAALARVITVFITGKRARRDFVQALRAEIRGGLAAEASGQITHLPRSRAAG
jgi:hypothetical protein